MRPKKLLGQNFLKDKNALNKIIQAADLKPDDIVIEIGPGTGILTEELAKRAGKVIAIEIDKKLAARLDSRLRGNGKIKIIHDDILKINLPELIKSLFVGTSRDLSLRKKYKLISNIPYYITSPIIRLFLETEYPPSEMILTLQKEVAERICAGSGQMSLLAVATQYYARPELLFYINKKSFWPAPKVDSAVIKISRISEQGAEINKNKEETQKFFRVVKAGFSAKRKTLVNNLSGSLHLDKKTVEGKLKKSGIGPTQRAQELSVKDWKKLAELF